MHSNTCQALPASLSLSSGCGKGNEWISLALCAQVSNLLPGKGAAAFPPSVLLKQELHLPVRANIKSETFTATVMPFSSRNCHMHTWCICCRKTYFLVILTHAFIRSVCRTISTYTQEMEQLFQILCCFSSPSSFVTQSECGIRISKCLPLRRN